MTYLLLQELGGRDSKDMGRNVVRELISAFPWVKVQKVTGRGKWFLKKHEEV